MKRLFFIFSFLCCVLAESSAQYYSINIDYKTIAAMSEAFATEAATEALHKENLQKISESYKAAEVASAGIFASKYLDRKALTNLNLWNDEQENHYYTRIYNIVTKRIIPKTITVAKLMLEDPSTAIYWGSYLLKTCDDVKSLCQQFESVVTNSTLSFKNVPFLEINDELKQVFNLTQLGGADWKSLFENIGDDIESSFTKENLEKDLDNLIAKGVGLASAGYSNTAKQLLQGTSFGGTFDNKANSILKLVDNASSMYSDFKNLTNSQLLAKLAGGNDVGSLFKQSDYSLSKWIDDYTTDSSNRYYTLRVYIYKRNAGSETVCNYNPPTDDNSVLYGAEWYRVETTDANFYPNSTQRDAALANSENYAGWSRSKVNQLNSQSSDYKYNISYSMLAYRLTNSRTGLYAKSYAYSISVTKYWDIREEIYEATFDSYSMDWETFMAQINARLQSYRANGDTPDIESTDDLNKYIEERPSETKYTYAIGYDTKHYYTATDARKLAGSSSATFNVTCHDGGTLGKGSTTYKCSSCTGSVTEHTKECAMYTTLPSTDQNIETSELQSKLTSYQAQSKSLQAELDNLNNENSELLRKMSGNSSSAEYNTYRKQYEENKSKITQLQKELDTVNRNITAIQQAITEAEEGEQVATDNYDRIPYMMKTMENGYHITWNDGGSWSGNVFTRKGTVGAVKGEVTFTATLSIARSPKYFLGIKIHRAIVQIDWALTSSWSDSSVAETMELDTNKSDEENAKIVNARMSELAQEYPNCDITVDYSKTNETTTEDTDGVNHLLWASDRLEIARGVEARLAKIYTDLVMVEKYMHYKHSLIDWVKDLLPKLNADKDRKMSIAEKCHKRWMSNGGSSQYSDDEE